MAGLRRFLESFAILSVPACAVIAGLEEKELAETPLGPGGRAGAAGTGTAGTGAGGMSGTNAGAGEGGSSTQGGEGGRPPSCAVDALGTGTNCGPAGNEDCCASSLVQGGYFDRFNDPEQPFSVSSFRLDRFEVTVGRFRAFVEAVNDGWRPQPGSGTHAHLEEGGAPGELGWQAAYDNFISESVESCPNDNYTSSPGDQDRQPIVCASYYHALAFCIWDRGYLPSSTELLYVTVGGDENSRYPWGDELDSARAVYGATALADVGSKPGGVGRWGQRDIIGNAWEIVADNEFYLHGCTRDCAYFDERWDAFAWGGSFESSSTSLADGNPRILYDRAGDDETGFRCARAP